MHQKSSLMLCHIRLKKRLLDGFGGDGGQGKRQNCGEQGFFHGVLRWGESAAS